MLPESVRGYPIRAFFICLLAYATAQMDLALFGFAIPSIRAEFELSLSGVMAIVSSAFLLGGLLLVALAVLTDRLGRKGMFQLSMIGSSILVTLHSIVPNPATAGPVTWVQHCSRRIDLSDYGCRNRRGGTSPLSWTDAWVVADWLSAWLGACLFMGGLVARQLGLALPVSGWAG